LIRETDDYFDHDNKFILMELDLKLKKVKEMEINGQTYFEFEDANNK